MERISKEAFLRELEKTLQCDPGSISLTTRLADTDWDSLGELWFLALADNRLGVRVEANRVSTCTSVADLLDLLGTSVSN